MTEAKERQTVMPEEIEVTESERGEQEPKPDDTGSPAEAECSNAEEKEAPSAPPARASDPSGVSTETGSGENDGMSSLSSCFIVLIFFPFFSTMRATDLGRRKCFPSR